MAETVVRKRPVTTSDRRGDQSTDWSATTDATFTARGIEPVSSAEDDDREQRIVTALRVYLDAGADVAAGDRMVIREVTYDVDGEPQDWRAPWGSPVGGVVVTLKAATG